MVASRAKTRTKMPGLAGPGQSGGQGKQRAGRAMQNLFRRTSSQGIEEPVTPSRGHDEKSAR